MKLVFTSLLYVFSVSICLWAQEIPDPEFSLRPYYLKANSLENLERVDAVVQTKVKAMGYGGADSYYNAIGVQSSVKFTQAESPRFFIKIDDPTDPMDLVVITKGDVKKNERRFKILSVNGPFGTRSSGTGNQVKFICKKVREGLYEIVLDGTLTSGEYAFMPISGGLSLAATRAKLSCFSVE
jgi:hypothetical protein